jgi:hypothetical protein
MPAPSFEVGARAGKPRTPRNTAGPDCPRLCFFNCIQEQGGDAGCPRPHSRSGPEQGNPAPQETQPGQIAPGCVSLIAYRNKGCSPRILPAERMRERAQKSAGKADSVGTGAVPPGPRLGRPCGPGFALRPGLIGRKDHGRVCAQAARQAAPQIRGRCPLNKTQAQAPSSPSSPCSPQAAARGSGRLRAGSCRDSPALSWRGPVPLKCGAFQTVSPSLPRENDHADAHHRII